LIVDARIEGKPDPAFELGEVIVAPTKVRVRGPASHVNALLRASTETISIEGRRESFDAQQTAVYVSDPKVDVLDPVSVHVKIAARGSAKPKTRETN
jgi:hypothetical protein